MNKPRALCPVCGHFAHSAGRCQLFDRARNQTCDCACDTPPCKACTGTGTDHKVPWLACPVCDGTGVRTITDGEVTFP